MGLFSTLGNFLVPGIGGTVGGVVDSAIGLGTSVGSSALSAYSASKSAREQIAWERERAQNAHQWEVADLRAAGLNPVLSAGGSGAVTGSINYPSFGGSLSSDINSARQTSINDAMTKSMISKNASDIVNQTELTQAQISMLRAQSANYLANSARTLQLSKYEASQLFRFGYESQYQNSLGGALASVLGAVLGSKTNSNSAKSVVLPSDDYGILPSGFRGND